MKQRTLAFCLKGVVTGTAICGLIVYPFILPACADAVAGAYPEAAAAKYPLLIFLWLTAIPCYAVLAFSWRIADSIGQDRSFTRSNARRLKWIARLAAGDSAFFLLGSLILLAAGLSHPALTALTLLIAFIGAAFTVAAAALAHLVGKAAALQEESDLTI